MTQHHGSPPGQSGPEQAGQDRGSTEPRHGASSESQHQGQGHGSSQSNPSTGSASSREQAEQLKLDARQVGSKAAEAAKAELERQGRNAAEQADRLAGTADEVASTLREEGNPELSQIVEKLAGGISTVADSLRSKNLDELMRDLRGVAQRNPAMFIAGSIVVGFGITRFARASAGGSGSSRLRSSMSERETFRTEARESSSGRESGGLSGWDAGVGRHSSEPQRTGVGISPTADAAPGQSSGPLPGGSVNASPNLNPSSAGSDRERAGRGKGTPPQTGGRK